jgi:hypothetical protein
MISSTIITSAIGVTLMSAMGPPRSRPTFIAKASSWFLVLGHLRNRAGSDSWSIEVVLRTSRGEGYRNRLVWTATGAPDAIR